MGFSDGVISGEAPKPRLKFLSFAVCCLDLSVARGDVQDTQLAQSPKVIPVHPTHTAEIGTPKTVPGHTGSASYNLVC